MCLLVFNGKFNMHKLEFSKEWTMSNKISRNQKKKKKKK